MTLSGASALAGFGNDLANTLTGNEFDNILDGRLGADTMIGGAGNDTYFVDHANDLTVEAVGEGIDTVHATASYRLITGAENLILIARSGARFGLGNEHNNHITGNEADNLLNGFEGADTLVGGIGNDSYSVDNASDVTRERADEGLDTVNAYINWTLGTNIERLILAPGSTARNGAGNELDNTITGNEFENILNGAAGNDTLLGGEARDSLNGDAGNDTLGGGTGEDNMSGGTGNDTLGGGVGNDRLDGGSGMDTYVFNRGDGHDDIAE